VYVFCAPFSAILPQSERAARAQANYRGADAGIWRARYAEMIPAKDNERYEVFRQLAAALG